MKLEFHRPIFEKYPNIKFYEDLFGESRVVPYGWTERRTDGRTDRQTWRS